MITNKDIRVENGFLIINGNKYPLDGQSPEAIMAIVEDNSDTTPTEDSTAPVQSGGVKTYVDTAIGDLTQTGVTGDSVADQITDISANLIKRSAGSIITITMPVVWGYFYPDQYTAKVPLPAIAPNTNYTIELVAVRADNVPDTVDILTGAEVVTKNNSYFEMRTPRNLSSYALPNVTSCRTGLVRYTITFA